MRDGAFLEVYPQNHAARNLGRTTAVIRRQPIADNASAEGRAKNRRVEIEVVEARTAAQ